MPTQPLRQRWRWWKAASRETERTVSGAFTSIPTGVVRSSTRSIPDTLAAKFSMQHILATTAHFGHAGAEALLCGHLADPAIGALREKVTIGAFAPEPDWPNDRPARVRWEMEDGRTATEEVLSARGGPDRPFDPEEITEKVVGIVEGPYPAMPAVLRSILALDPARLSRPWNETVTEMTGPST